MIDDKLGVEILELMDLIRKRYGKTMKEKDRDALMDVNKRLYAKVGGIVKDPMVHQNPLSKPVATGGTGTSSGAYQVARPRQAESVDLQRLARMAMESILTKK